MPKTSISATNWHVGIILNPYAILLTDFQRNVIFLAFWYDKCCAQAGIKEGD